MCACGSSLVVERSFWRVLEKMSTGGVWLGLCVLFVAGVSGKDVSAPRTMKVSVMSSGLIKDLLEEFVDVSDHVKIEYILPLDSGTSDDIRIVGALVELGVPQERILPERCKEAGVMQYRVRTSGRDFSLQVRKALSNIPVRITEVRGKKPTDADIHVSRKTLRERAIAEAQREASNLAETFNAQVGKIVNIVMSDVGSTNADVIGCELSMEFELDYDSESNATNITATTP